APQVFRCPGPLVAEMRLPQALESSEKAEYVPRRLHPFHKEREISMLILERFRKDCAGFWVPRSGIELAQEPVARTQHLLGRRVGHRRSSASFRRQEGRQFLQSFRDRALSALATRRTRSPDQAAVLARRRDLHVELVRTRSPREADGTLSGR